MPLDLFTRLDPLRRVRCPYCFEQFAALDLHVQCESQVCQDDFGRQVEDPILTRAFFGPQAESALRGPWWTDPRRDPRRGRRRYLDWLLLPDALTCPHCNEPTSCRLCPKCHHRLPIDALFQQSGHIAIFGPQSVGKTTYLTVVLHEFDYNVGPDRGLLLDPIDDDIRQRYRQEYHDVTYGSGHLGVGVSSTDNGAPRPHSPSAPLEMNPRALQPLVYRVKRRPGSRSRPLISISDMAGEDWEMNFHVLKHVAGPLIRNAQGLLFLIDPLRLPQVANDPRLELTDKEKFVPPADYREDLQKLLQFFDRAPVKVPLAIGLNKLDRWGPLMAEGTMLHELARSVPGKPLDSDVDQLVHEEVRAAMRRWNQLPFLEQLTIDFPNHRFFAVSALGDAAQTSEDAPQPLPTPLLVERPLVWLLQQQKLIK